MNLETLAREIIVCTQCPLYLSRQKAVPGEGNPSAKIFLIGEAPGSTEDREGRPFVGLAGKFLDQMLDSVQLTRKDIFITNVVKCHPEKNREPKPDEIKICTENYLFNQLALIKPRLITLLGRTPVKVFFPEIKKLVDVHGKLLEKDDQRYFILYHPALALHRQDLRPILVDDFQKIKQYT